MLIFTLNSKFEFHSIFTNQSPLIQFLCPSKYTRSRRIKHAVVSFNFLLLLHFLYHHFKLPNVDENLEN